MRKQTIYVILSGTTPLHAVCTERQAKQFLASYGLPADDCRLFLGELSYKKIKLIPPRKFTEGEKKRIKEITNARVK